MDGAHDLRGVLQSAGLLLALVIDQIESFDHGGRVISDVAAVRAGGKRAASARREVDDRDRKPFGRQPRRPEFGDDLGRDPGETGVELRRVLDRSGAGHFGGAERSRKEKEEKTGDGPRQDRAPRESGTRRATPVGSAARSRRLRRTIRNATVPTAVQGTAIRSRIE